jgi:hypothetical protein
MSGEFRQAMLCLELAHKIPKLLCQKPNVLKFCGKVDLHDEVLAPDLILLLTTVLAVRFGLFLLTSVGKRF